MVATLDIDNRSTYKAIEISVCWHRVVAHAHSFTITASAVCVLSKHTWLRKNLPTNVRRDGVSCFLCFVGSRTYILSFRPLSKRYFDLHRSRERWRLHHLSLEHCAGSRYKARSGWKFPSRRRSHRRSVTHQLSTIGQVANHN